MAMGELGATTSMPRKVVSSSLVKQKERTCTIETIEFSSLVMRKSPEKVEYEHVGVKINIFNGDTSGIGERLAKAHRALNAISGLGIRKCGLSIVSCSVLF